MSQPSWQEGKCPSWCDIEHAEDDLPLDRSHRDTGTDVPAVLRIKTLSQGTLSYEVKPGTLTFGRWQHISGHEEWVLIGDNEGNEIEMSLNSFRRLLRALDEFASEEILN